MDDNFENKEIIFIGDGALEFKDKIKENLKNVSLEDEKLNTLNSYNLGICGYKKYLNGFLSNKDLLPLYLKKPQAEKLLEEKLKDLNNNG